MRRSKDKEADDGTQREHRGRRKHREQVNVPQTPIPKGDISSIDMKRMYNFQVMKDSVKPFAMEETNSSSYVSMLRVIMFFFTSLLLLCSFVIIILASLGIFHGSKHNVTDRGDMLALSIILLFIGFLALAVTIFGFVVINTDSKETVMRYAGVLGFTVLLMFAYLVGIIAGAISGEAIKKRSEEDMIYYMKLYNNKTNSARDWNNTQQWFECCGVSSYVDWQLYKIKIPLSCCRRTIKDVCNISMAYNLYSEATDGCERKIFNYVKEKLKILAAVLIIFMISSLIVIVLGNCISSQSGSGNQY